MTYTYTPKGVCSRKMTVELDKGGVIKAVRVDGGCSGNLQGIRRLVVGMTAQDAIERMESELGRPCTAVVTGGLGRFVVPHCRRRLVYDEHLLLRGLGMIWRRAQGEIHSCGAMGNAV